MAAINASIDRRDLLKGTALGGVGLAVASALPAVALAKQVPAAVDNPEAREVSLVENEADVAAKVAETMECDIAVVGSGAAGLSAAVKAAQLGASVILLEKAAFLGGSTNGTEGMFGWGSSLQQETGVEMPLVAELIQDELTYSNYRIDAALWKRFINASGKSVDWLRDLGYEFDRVDVYKGNISSFKCYHWWKDQAGSTMIEALAAKAEELGVQILMETPGVCLMTEDGKVCGVYGHKLADDSYLGVKAKATIVGTGGFGLNNPLIEQLTTWDMTYGTTRSTGTGDGVIMCEDAGAGTYMTAILPRTAVEGYTVYDEIAIGCCDNPLLFLNENGDRFMNEGTYVTSYMALYVNPIMSQKKAYTVFDQAMVDRFVSGEGIISGWRKYKPGMNLEDFQVQLDESVECGRGNVFKADSIEDLAEAMGTGVDACKLYKETYNYAMSGGLVSYCLYSGLNAATNAVETYLA